MKQSYVTILLSILCTSLIAVIAFVQTAHGQAQDAQQVARAIGWLPDVDSESLCKGYYQEPNLFVSPVNNEPLPADKIEIDGESILFSQQGASNLRNVSVSQPGKRITANKAILIRDPKTKKISLIKLYGNIRLYEPGKLLTGRYGQVYLQTKQAKIVDAYYRVLLKAQPSLEPEKTQAKTKKLQGLVAWGHAKKIAQPKSGIINIYQGSYTTCQPNKLAWHVTAKRISLDRQAGRGTAKNALFYIAGTPLLYVPYMSFPIDNRRKTGFLLPEYDYSSRSGQSLNLPFYLNLLPNADDTFTPNYLSKRGVMYRNMLRYVTNMTSGMLHFGYLPHDRAFKSFQQSINATFPNKPLAARERVESFSDNRKFIFFNQTTDFNEHWQANLQYNHVSDDYFFQDFPGDTPPNNVFANQLLQHAQIRYVNNIWDLQGLVQKYQTLHPINEVTYFDQYQQLPELDANAEFPQFGPFVISLNSQLVNFRHSPEIFNDPLSGLPYANAKRAELQPAISLPIVTMPGYIIPTLQLRALQYDINTAAWPESSITRTTPIFDVDSGLTFIRNTDLLQHHYEQTLEPRLFYLNVPFRNQNDIPVFDTINQTFTYDQMFRTNEFAGLDRLQNANQLAYGLTSRLLNGDNGIEKARVSIGQTYYMQDRKVTLCRQPYCTITNVDPSYNKSFSPIALISQVTLIPHTTITDNAAFNWNQRNFTNNTITFNYFNTPRHIFYISYSYMRQLGILAGQTELLAAAHQTSLGSNWGINKNISVLGVITNTSAANTPAAKSFVFGVQYDTCCWATRLVAGRTLAGRNDNLTPRYDKRVFLQLLLKGFGNVGTGGADGILTSGIPGYNDSFTRQRAL